MKARLHCSSDSSTSTFCCRHELLASAAAADNQQPAALRLTLPVLPASACALLPSFCTSYCGWHTCNYISSTAVTYGFVDNGDHCPGSCYTQSTSPNGKAGADGI